MPVVEQVKAQRADPAAGENVRQVDVGDAFIYPGLTDLHSHLGFATLPMWEDQHRKETGRPWLHRDLWPGADSYKPNVSWPAYAYMKGAPEALLAYAQVRALAGGTTSIQGWPPAKGEPVNRFVRSVDDDIDRDAIRTSVINLRPAELDDRRQHLDDNKALVYHLSEGQRDSKVAREFAETATAGCLRHRLIAIHCSAVGPDEFRQWRVHAELAGEPSPGGVVWSPLSNLWLYGETTDVVAAMAEDITVCLGSDWGPSGSRNLLGEMKAAIRWIQHAGLAITPFELAQMVTCNPGDLLRAGLGNRTGPVRTGPLADAVVIERRHDDPWVNLALARERDVQLVVSNGRAVYGDRDLMRAAGERSTTALRFQGQSKHIPLRRPDDPSKRWTWNAVMDELERVQADPVTAIDQALAAEALWFDDSDEGELAGADPRIRHAGRTRQRGRATAPRADVRRPADPLGGPRSELVPGSARRRLAGRPVRRSRRAVRRRGGLAMMSRDRQLIGVDAPAAKYTPEGKAKAPTKRQTAKRTRRVRPFRDRGRAGRGGGHRPRRSPRDRRRADPHHPGHLRPPAAQTGHVRDRPGAATSSAEGAGGVGRADPRSVPRRRSGGSSASCATPIRTTSDRWPSKGGWLDCRSSSSSSDRRPHRGSLCRRRFPT